MSDRPDLPNLILANERAVLAGDMLSMFTYGISFIVSTQALYFLFMTPRRFAGKQRNWILIIYASFTFTLASIFIGMDLHSLQLMFIDHRAGPGGPTAYSLSQYNTPIVIIPNVFGIFAGWLADGFLLYRCLVIFQLKIAYVALPLLIYTASIPMGIMLLFQSSQPNANLWTKLSVNFGIPYFSLSVSLNIIITLAISARLFFYRRAFQKNLATTGNLPYVGIAAMLIESCALYAITSLLFIVPYALNSAASHIFLPVLIQVQVLAPMLIILRVADQRGWQSNTAAVHLSTMQFQNNHDQSGNTFLGEQEVGVSSGTIKDVYNAA